jgi:hypothetical protein
VPPHTQGAQEVIGILGDLWFDRLPPEFSISHEWCHPCAQDVCVTVEHRAKERLSQSATRRSDALDRKHILCCKRLPVIRAYRETSGERLCEPAGSNSAAASLHSSS